MHPEALYGITAILLLWLFVRAYRRKRSAIELTTKEKKNKKGKLPVEPESQPGVEAKDESVLESETIVTPQPPKKETHEQQTADHLPGPEPPEEDLTQPVEKIHEIAAAPPARKKKEQPAQKPLSVMEKLRIGLSKTRASIAGRLENLVTSGKSIDAEILESIEEALISADIGIETTIALTERIEKNSASIDSQESLRDFLKNEIRTFLDIPDSEVGMSKPHVIMVVGVNGVGKTTTIGKLASMYNHQGKKVLLGAADTFRAAACEQLAVWADRANAQIVKHRDKADPAAVAFDSVSAALSRDIDVVIIDTAGRLHTRVNLMEELKKIKKSIGKKLPGAPHETLLVLDATTGQNALAQAKLFHESIGISGIILTKLDGTAKGGIVIGIAKELELPIKYIGVGEGIDDLQPFDPDAFVEALF